MLESSSTALSTYRQRLTLPQRDAAVPSACPGLTFVFGMETGVSLGLLPPIHLHNVYWPARHISAVQSICHFSGQALDQLVLFSLTCCHAYTFSLSTSFSLRGLTGLIHGKSYLEACFTLRCFQRLSVPDLATQLCHWRDNWCTIGPSISVLSY